MKIFDTFSCFQLRDGLFVMDVAPNVICWESREHQVMVVVSIICIGVYVIGIPAFALGTMLYARRNDYFRHRQFLTGVVQHISYGNILVMATY